MFARFMPQEGKFFDLFNAHTEQAVLSAQKCLALINTLSGERRAIDELVQAIESAEQRADTVTHETIALLHKTFITPV
jgi:uncharacterized protein Yka (UPF0111/DUF47 family)